MQRIAICTLSFLTVIAFAMGPLGAMAAEETAPAPDKEPVPVIEEPIGEPVPGEEGGSDVIGMPNPFSLPMGIDVDDFTLVPAGEPDVFHVEVEATLISSEIVLKSHSVELDGNVILAFVELEWPNEEDIVGPLDEAPFWLRVGTATLPEGKYELWPIVNGYKGLRTVLPVHAKGTEVEVGRPVPTEEWFPPEDTPGTPVDYPDRPGDGTVEPEKPQDDPPGDWIGVDQGNVKIYNPGIEFEPANPKPGEPFGVYLTGEFPTPGFEFVSKDLAIAESFPEQLLIDVTVSAPEGEVIQVIQPFREFIGTASVSGGEHRYNIVLNGESIHTGVATVGESKRPDGAVEAGGVLIYGIGLEYEPATPQPGEPFEVFLTGEFPTPGYVFTMKELAIAESLPEQLFIEVRVCAPEGPVAEVITPFRESVGTAIVSGGEHPVRIHLNGVSVYTGSVAVRKPGGEGPLPPENGSKEVYSFSGGLDDSEFSPAAPAGYEMGEVSYGEMPVSAEESAESLTDGAGVTVTLDPGEGVTLYGPPVDVNGAYAVVRVSAWTDDAGVAIGVGALDAESAATLAEAGLNGSIGVTLLQDTSRLVERFGVVEAVFKPERTAAVPVVQAVNPHPDKTVTARFDQLEIVRVTTLATE